MLVLDSSIIFHCLCWSEISPTNTGTICFWYLLCTVTTFYMRIFLGYTVHHIFLWEINHNSISCSLRGWNYDILINNIVYSIYIYRVLICWATILSDSVSDFHMLISFVFFNYFSLPKLIVSLILFFSYVSCFFIFFLSLTT